MFQLKKNFRFDASHHLHSKEGPRRGPHAHAWIGYILVEGNDLSELNPKSDTLIDYAVLGNWTKPITENLNNKDLNAVVDAEMPSNELTAQFIYHLLSPRFKDLVKLVGVGIRENCAAAYEYRP